jgi:GNAT superfamily N-acetyltransferase
LFIDEQHRGKKLGCKLLHFVEQEAKAMGAMLSHLDTFDFQAKDFYLKQGNTQFGILEDCPKGHKRYYLSKTLTSNN